MKLLVTGGCGFIGHTLVKDLLEDGHDVTVIDTNPIGFKHDSLTFIKKSVQDDLREDMKGMDAIYHLAAFLGVESSDKLPLKTLEINIDGTVNVFKCAYDAGVKRIVYSSSSEVYGEAQEIPLREESPKAPVSVYGVSKLTAEMYAMAYSKQKGMHISPVRFFNVYGPGQGYQWVVPLFIEKVIKGENPIVFGDGSQVRCFTYIQDIVDGMKVVMEKGEPMEAYNIANDIPITMKELAELISSFSDKNITPEIAGFGEKTRLREREIIKRVPSIEKLKQLKWTPKVSPQDGLKKTFEWYKEHFGKEELFYT